MNLSPEEFQRQLLQSFGIEAEERLQALTQGLLELEELPPEKRSQDTVERLFREMHSLKGAARAVNLTSVEAICQTVEDIFSDLKRGKTGLTPYSFKTLYTAIDFIRASIAGTSLPMDQNQLIQHLQVREGTAAFDLMQVKSAALSDDLTIRVSTKRLNRLLEQLEEMLVIKLSFQKKVIDIESLKKYAIQFQERWELIQIDVRILKESFLNQSTLFSNSKERMIFQKMLDFFDWMKEHCNRFDEHIEKVLKEVRYNSYVTSGMIDAVLAEAKQVLMQPFQILLLSMKKMARDLAVSLNKKVQVVIEGGEIELDKRIHDELKDPLVHLIRNSIDHGIESPEERVKAGKPEEGTIRLSVTRLSGGRISIVVADDGRGVNILKLKTAAVKANKLTQQEADALTDNEALQLILIASLSTAEQITTLSGRGLGGGIIADKVERIGGTISIDSQLGKGTTFTIFLMSKLATFRGLHVQSGGYGFIIPSQNITRILRIQPNEVKTVEGKKVLHVNDQVMSYVSLNQVLGVEEEKKECSPTKVPVFLIRYGDTVVAVAVDAILKEQEFFVKNFKKPIEHIQNFSSATITEEGNIIPVIDPYDFFRSILHSSHQKFVIKKKSTKKEKEASTILVVEDSMLSRMLLKNILLSVGYRVQTAVDGVEALLVLKNESIDLLIVDIEMPRMNGLELTKNIRKMKEYSNLPIIVCSSLGSKIDQERGIECGANAYVVKKDFKQSQLLDVVKQFI